MWVREREKKSERELFLTLKNCTWNVNRLLAHPNMVTVRPDKAKLSSLTCIDWLMNEPCCCYLSLSHYLSLSYSLSHIFFILIRFSRNSSKMNLRNFKNLVASVFRLKFQANTRSKIDGFCQTNFYSFHFRVVLRFQAPHKTRLHLARMLYFRIFYRVYVRHMRELHHVHNSCLRCISLRFAIHICNLFSLCNKKKL